ncbi:MAG TPA: AraC family transcriptional regulator [Leptospiraceae bacterium]|nr:AraC family transcriptional regulator [Leptospiraceae bacterium]HMY46368.1 AraC family transcriptional regulator [Leptospiraceae bacterium]HMZ37834.1 AraC family transcriptional regulator [Leptospiraceae bacterium]HNE25344.1 AraC family transcriptional regulator [Leptospiraceae bacterium]HNJ34509.1 AraC family transcriptional regulator [Leptospiraceae bacterium]
MLANSIDSAALHPLHFVFTGGVLSALFAAGYWISGQKRSRVLAAIFLCLAVVLIHGYLVLSREILLVPRLLYVHVPFLYLLGPLSFLWLRLLLEEDPPHKWLHYIPAALMLVLMTPLYLADPEWKRSLALGFYQGNVPLPARFVFGGGLLSYVIYIVLSVRFLWPSLRSPDFYKDRSVRIAGLILIYATLICLVAFLSLLLGFPVALHWMLMMLAAFPPALYLLGARYPDLFFEFKTALSKGRYEQSRLQGMDLGDLRSRIERLMREEELFGEEKLTIEDVAGRLGISVHALSEFINLHEKTNFPGYINALRIGRACELMENDPARTILSIAYDVGFSAKSTFNAAFLRHRGMSPTAFRAKLQKRVR